MKNDITGYQKFWRTVAYCLPLARVGLRDDLPVCVYAQTGGMSYLLARGVLASGDYVERLTYLLFLKMIDEQI